MKSGSSVASQSGVIRNLLLMFFFFISHAHAAAPTDTTFEPLYNILAGYYGSLFVPLAILLAAVMIIYAGILYTTSEGQPEKVNVAKEYIFGAIIGLLIVLGAGWIVSQIVG